MTVDWPKMLFEICGVSIPVVIFLYGILSQWARSLGAKMDKTNEIFSVKLDKIGDAVQAVRETAIVQGKDIAIVQRDHHDHTAADELRFGKTDSELTGMRLTLSKIEGKLFGRQTHSIIGDQE